MQSLARPRDLRSSFAPAFVERVQLRSRATHERSALRPSVLCPLQKSSVLPQRVRTLTNHARVARLRGQLENSVRRSECTCPSHMRVERGLSNSSDRDVSLPLQAPGL